jgi:hypothetical protein
MTGTRVEDFTRRVPLLQNLATEPIRWEQSATLRAPTLIGERLKRACARGGTAATDTQWGDCALRWLVSRVHDQLARLTRRPSEGSA